MRCLESKFYFDLIVHKLMKSEIVEATLRVIGLEIDSVFQHFLTAVKVPHRSVLLLLLLLLPVAFEFSHV